MMAKIRQICKTTDVIGSTRNSAMKRHTYETPIKGVSSVMRPNSTNRSVVNPNVNEVVHNQKSFQKDFLLDQQPSGVWQNQDRSRALQHQSHMAPYERDTSSRHYNLEHPSVRKTNKVERALMFDFQDDLFDQEEREESGIERKLAQRRREWSQLRNTKE